MVDTLGWTELFDGNMIGAAFVMFNTAMGGWFIALLFLTYQIMIYLKTRHLPLVWFTSLLFLALYGAIPGMIKQTSVQFMFVIMVFELGAMLYYMVFK